MPKTTVESGLYLYQSDVPTTCVDGLKPFRLDFSQILSAVTYIFKDFIPISSVRLLGKL